MAFPFLGVVGGSGKSESNYTVISSFLAGGVLAGIIGAGIGSNLEYTFTDSSEE